MGRRKIEIEPITVCILEPSSPLLCPVALSGIHADSDGPLVCSQHERNRSVTFLKASADFAIYTTRKVLANAYFCTFDIILFNQRKNGLFKKAYELGVLCSVDIAVIIFGRCSSPRSLAVYLLSRRGTSWSQCQAVPVLLRKHRRDNAKAFQSEQCNFVWYKTLIVLLARRREGYSQHERLQPQRWARRRKRGR
jgi:hypothetical protein